MVTKAELYQSGRERLSGISETISRKSREYEERKAEEKRIAEEKKIEQINLYQDKLSKGEIKNVNQIPPGIRNYFNFKEIQDKTKNELSQKISEFSNKAKELKNTYETKLSDLQRWRDSQLEKADSSDERDSIRESYKLEKADLRKDYKPDIDYYETYSSQLNKLINEIDKGELISSEYALKVAENKAKYDQKQTEANYRNELSNLKYNIVESYVDKINKGEIKLKDIPKQFQKYISTTETIQESTTKTIQETIQTPIYVDTSGNPVSVTPGYEDKYETLEEYNERTKSPFLADKLKLKTDTNILIKQFTEPYKKEVERYSNLGYNSEYAKVLAQESLKQGGVSFSPEYSKEILTNYEINKWENKKNQNIFENVLKLGKDILNFAKKDNILPTASIQLSRENTQDLRTTLNTLNDLMNSIYDRISYGISEKEAENYREKINKIQKELKKDKGGYITTSWGLLKPANQELLNEYEQKLNDLNQRLEIGSSSPTAKLATIGLDISSDFLIPGKGVSDVVIFANQLIPKEKDMITFYRSVKESEIEKTIEELPKEAKTKLNNFFTNAEQKKELNNLLEENKKEIEKTKNLISKKEIDKQNGEIYIRNLENQNRELESIKKELNENKLFTIGTIGYIALTAIGSILARKITTKVSNNYDEVLSEVKKLNSYKNTPIKEVPYVSSTFSDLKKADVNTINKYLKVSKISLDDVSSVKITGSSEEFSGGYFVKKIPKEIKLKGLLKDKSTLPPTTTKMDYYTIGQKPNYWNNKINIDVRLKDGNLKSFSIISKSPKPIPNYNNIANVLKYGTNKKLIVSSQLGDSGIVGAVQFRQRAGKFTAEDYWMGKKTGTKQVEIRRKSKVSEDLIKERNKILGMSESAVKKKYGVTKDKALTQINEKLSPESYWLYAEPVASVKTRVFKQQATPSKQISISDDSFFQFSRINEAGYRKIIRNDLNIDTGRFTFIIQSYINNLKKMPKSKLSSSKKALLNLGDDITKAYKSGKSNYLLTSDKVKQLSMKDLSLIYDSIGSISMPKNKFKIVSKNAQNFLDNLKKTTSTLQKSLISISSKLNRISTQTGNAYWNGISQNKKTDMLNIIREEKKQNNKLQDKTKNLIKQNSELINSLISKQNEITAYDQVNLLSSLTNQLSTQQSQLNQLNSSLLSQMNSLNSLITQINNLPKETTIPSTFFQPIGISKKTIKEKEISPFERDFKIFARKGGKDLEFGSAKTKTEAKKKLKSLLDTTLRASGFIESGGKKVLFKDFGADFVRSKKDPWRIVEKRSKRLSSKKEVKDIQKAKKSQKKTKKIKSAESYWLK